MRVVQVVPTLDNPAAGPTYSVLRLTEALNLQSTESVVFCTKGPKNTVRRNVDIVCHPTSFNSTPVLKNLLVSPALRLHLADEVRRGSILHTHGLWLMPNIYPAMVIQNSKSPLILAPRGMLAPGALQFSKIKKRMFNFAIQRRALDVVTCFHATAESELEDIRKAGFRTPVAIISNGVDIPPPLNPTPHPPTVLCLGRVHPKKGLDRLVRAWAPISNRHKTARLRIVGPSEIGYVDELKALAKSLKLERITFESGLFGGDRLAAFQSADVFALPTLSENFGMVVAEALAAGVPVVCSKGAPWQGLEDQQCGWWIDHGIQPLANALDDALSRPRSELAEMGQRGRQWMQRDFSWTRIANEMADVYRWCSGSGDRPKTIMID